MISQKTLRRLSEVLSDEIAQKWLEGGSLKKVIVVKGKIIVF